MVPSNDLPIRDWVLRHADGLSAEQVSELEAWAHENLSSATKPADDEQLVHEIEEQLLMEQVARLRRYNSLLSLRANPADEAPVESYYLDPQMMIHDPADSSESSDTTRMEDTDDNELTGDAPATK